VSKSTFVWPGAGSARFQRQCGSRARNASSSATSLGSAAALSMFLTLLAAIAAARLPSLLRAWHIQSPADNWYNDTRSMAFPAWSSASARLWSFFWLNHLILPLGLRCVLSVSDRNSSTAGATNYSLLILI